MISGSLGGFWDDDAWDERAILGPDPREQFGRCPYCDAFAANVYLISEHGYVWVEAVCENGHDFTGHRPGITVTPDADGPSYQLAANSNVWRTNDSKPLE